jgi:hypothetical protein
MDSITRIKNFIGSCFPNWEKVDFSEFEENIDFRKEWSELYKISGGEIILISYTNISITGTDRAKPQLRVFLDEYKKPFYFAKKHQLRFYLFSIFTKEDNMARGLNNFNPKEYIISIETNLDNEDSRRDLRSIYDYANIKLNGSKFLKCTRANYKADINQASFIYIGTQENPEKDTFETFINMFDSRPYINSANGASAPIQRISPLKSDTKNLCYLAAIRTKPFLLLAGISGTGKSRIVRELAFMTCLEELQDEDGTTPGNYCMIEVKPNWHDSSELLGYYSSFNGGGYRFTKFDRFVIKAWLNPDVPFFVCLDEMNLAPVEQYFAEFLSVLETRSRDQEGHVVTGALVDKQYFKDDTKMKEDLGLDGADDWAIKVRSDLVNKGLTLPPNLIVIGTVNMDDTTYQFSRKVIDRAMTIEMNGGELSQMFGNSNSLKYRSDEDVVKLGMFKAPYINADEVIERYQSQAQIIKEKLPEKLEAVNTALKDTPFQVSYRVLNELVIYLGALMDEATAKGEAIDDDALPALIDQAMDQITLMKILPRIEGDEDMFKRSGGTNVLKTLQSLFSEETDSYKKLKEMIDRLDRTGFTRFWP